MHTYTYKTLSFHLIQDPLVGHAPGTRSGEAQCVRNGWFRLPNRIQECKGLGYPMISKLLQASYFSILFIHCQIMCHVDSLCATHDKSQTDVSEKNRSFSGTFEQFCDVVCVCVCPWLSYGTGQWTEKAWLLNHSCAPGVHNNAAWNGCR